MLNIDALEDFRPGAGTPVPGMVSGSEPETHFTGNIAVGQLLMIAPDPRLVENPKYHFVDPRLAELQELRREIQRLFSAAKARNVPRYTEYIKELVLGHAAGKVPPIQLYWPQRLQIAKAGGQAVLVVPFRTGLVAIDADTQLAAWHEAARQSPDVMGYHIDVSVDHGKPIEWAKQAFHDLNVFGIKPNPTLAIYMDTRDPMNRIAKDLGSRFFSDRIEVQARQAAARSGKLFTIAALRLFVVCFAQGTAGVANATRPVPYSEPEQLRIGAAAWMQDLVNKLPGKGLAARESVFTTPPMLAALGAMGHAGIAASSLSSVVWERDAKDNDGNLIWDGIAGKRGRREPPTLAVGGPKEYVHSCYRALSDRASAEFDRVRSRVVAGTSRSN